MTEKVYRCIIRKLGLSEHEYVDTTDGKLYWLRQRVMRFLRTGKMPFKENESPIVGGYTEGLIFPLMRAAGASTETIREVDKGRQVFKLPFAKELVEYSMDMKDYDSNCKLYGYNYKAWNALYMTADVVWYFFETGLYLHVNRYIDKQPVNRAVIKTIMSIDGADEKTINEVIEGKYPYIFKRKLKRTPNLHLFYYPEFEAGEIDI